MQRYVCYVLDYGCELVLLFCVVFSGTNWSVDILRLEDALLQVFHNSKGGLQRLELFNEHGSLQ